VSVEAMTEVFKHSPYTLGTRLVHLAIADVVNDGHDWLFWGAQSSLAAKAKVSRRTVMDAIDKMINDGYLALVEERPGYPNAYRFLRPWAGGCAEFSQGGEKLLRTGCEEQRSEAIFLTEVKPKGRASRCPEPFLLTSDMREWAAKETPRLDVRKETASFVDYWRGAPGAKGLKVDWIATWRNSLRRSNDRLPGGSTPPASRERRNYDMPIDHSAFVPPELAAPPPAELRAMIPNREEPAT
jgi:hypothetical protein